MKFGYHTHFPFDFVKAVYIYLHFLTPQSFPEVTLATAFSSPACEQLSLRAAARADSSMRQSLGLLHVHRRSLPSWVLMCWEHQALEPAGRAPTHAFTQGSGEPAGPRRLIRRLPVGKKAQLPLCPVFCFCVDTEEPYRRTRFRFHLCGCVVFLYCEAQQV